MSRPECAAAGSSDAAAALGCWCSEADWNNPLGDGFVYRLTGAIPDEWMVATNNDEGVDYDFGFRPPNLRIDPYTYNGITYYEFYYDFSDAHVSCMASKPTFLYSPPAEEYYNYNSAEAGDWFCVTGGSNDAYPTPRPPIPMYAHPNAWFDLDNDTVFDGYTCNGSFAAPLQVDPTTVETVKGTYVDDYGYTHYAQWDGQKLYRIGSRIKGVDGFFADLRRPADKRVQQLGNWNTSLVSV